MKFKKVLVANRGEIACRIMRSLRRLDIGSVAVYSEADRSSVHMRSADQSYFLGPAESKDSYLAQEKIITACKALGVHAVHPGYGFLSENAEFARNLSKHGIVFIGPRPETITLLGDKIEAKRSAEKAGVPLVPGCQIQDSSAESVKQIEAFAKKSGFPLIIKAAAGGGGRGMRRVDKASELPEKLQAASREAQAFFGDGRVFVEKLVEQARHIEVQILGDTHGEVRHLFDRDCSMQRNHQKVIEEAPAPAIPDKVRAAIHSAAVTLCKSVGYQNAGTVEFLLDRDNQFYFLEVNSRLQVEHPVTEMITGLDLVELQVRIAQGEKLSEMIPAKLAPRGAAIECRVCAENPDQGFIAATGKLSAIEFPEIAGANVRFDSGFEAGSQISHYYDSLLGKVVIRGADRDTALCAMRQTLSGGRLFGVQNNLGFLLRLLGTAEFAQVKHEINFAASLSASADAPAERIHAAALLEIFNMLARRDALESWSTPSAFRLAGACAFELSRKASGIEISFRLKNVGGLKFEVGAANGAPYCIEVLELHPDSMRFASASGESFVQLSACGRWIQGEFGSFEIGHHYPKLRVKSAGEAHSAAEICAALPGKVLSIAVQRGAQVAEGEPLLSIESMKMEHIIRAPRDAAVAEVCVSAGDVIEAGRILIKLEA